MTRKEIQRSGLKTSRINWCSSRKSGMSPILNVSDKVIKQVLGFVKRSQKNWA